MPTCRNCTPRSNNCSTKSNKWNGFAAQHNMDEQAALQKGMEQKAVEFVKHGGAGLSQGVSLLSSVTETGRIAARLVFNH